MRSDATGIYKICLELFRGVEIEHYYPDGNVEVQLDYDATV